MGLDWRPLNKPHQGSEKEYGEIFEILSGRKKPDVSLIDKLFGKQKSQEDILKRFLEISSPAYETLKAPRVGKDEKANDWAKKQFENRSDKSLTLENFVKQMDGFYVLDLVPECDGMPVYIAIHDEAHVFRAQFLKDCEEIIGEEMMGEAYTSQLAGQALDFGERLFSLAEKYAIENNCLFLKDQKSPTGDEGSPESKAHILFSASKWLIFWGKRGHGYEASF